MTANDKRRTNTAKYFHLTLELATDGGVKVAMDEFESIKGEGAFMADFVNNYFGTS